MTARSFLDGPRRLYGPSGKRQWRRWLALLTVLVFFLSPHVVFALFDERTSRLLGPVLVVWLLLYEEAAGAGRVLYRGRPQLAARALGIAYAILVVALFVGLALAAGIAASADPRLYGFVALLAVQTLVLSLRLPALVALCIAPDGSADERSGAQQR